MDEFSEAINAFFSNDNIIRSEAESYLCQKIAQEPLFYQAIFNLYPEFPFVKKKLALILIKNQIRNNPSSISDNFSDFSQRLMSCVKNESNIELFSLLATIIIQTAINCDEIWPDFETYLTLFKENKVYVPLCLYIFEISSNNLDYLPKYLPLIRRISSTIILYGLKDPHIKIKILSTSFFIHTTKKIDNPEVFEKSKPFCDLIYSIAKSSIDFSEEDFNLFWSRLIKINPIIAEPFYLLSREFLQNEKLSPYSLSALLRFIFQKIFLVKEDEYDELIKSFFYLQTEVDDIDPEELAFNFYFISEPTYGIVKNYMLEYVTSTDPKYKKVGLALLKNFYYVYSRQMLNDVSVFIDAVLSDKSISQDDLHDILDFFQAINEFNSDDSCKIFDFLIEVIMNFQQSDIQKSCLNVFRQFNRNSYFFEKLIKMQPLIQRESVPLYLNLLYQMYLADSNLANKKYDDFFNSIIEISKEAFQNAQNMISEFEAEKENFDNYDEFFFALDLCGSCAIFITNFNFYIPYKFEDVIQPAIDSIFAISQYNDIFEKFERSSLISVDYEFAAIFKLTKSIYIDYVRPHYEFLSATNDFEKLKCLLIEVDGTNCPFLEPIIENFCNESDSLMGSKSVSLEDLINFTIHKVKNMSRWIYKVLDADFHMKYLGIIKFTFINLGIKSHEIGCEIINCLKAMVSPKRLQYYKENNVEWLSDLIENIMECAMYILDSILSHKSDKGEVDFFVEYLILFYIFIRINNDYGHEFFMNYLMPSYQTNTGLYNDRLLVAFYEMLKYEYYNKEELEIIIQVVDNVIKENLNYIDVRTIIYKVILKLSKIDIGVGNHYLEHALDEFNSTKEQDKKYIRSSIAVFLLSIFNADTQKFNDIQELLPEILSLFPICEIDLFELFVNEMDILVQKNNQIFSKEIVESLIAAYLRFFSYLSNSAILFRLNDEKFNEIIQTLKSILDSYISNFEGLTYNDIVSNILSEQPASIEYVMSLLSS